MRRQLSDTLLDIISSMPVLPAVAPGRVTRMDFDLPLEVEIRTGTDGVFFLADLPRWRWPTAFDPARSRIRFSVSEAR